MKTAAAPTHLPHSHKRVLALAGNPNSGKTTLFNALTGLRQKVGNYAGVTVERKIGTFRLDEEAEWDVLDLPGAYSLTARSPEEEIARNVLLGEMPDTPRPDVVLVVADASNLERNLYLASQILGMGVPTILGLNMVDVAADLGVEIDIEQLAHEIGVPVVPMVASHGEGIEELKQLLRSGTVPTPPPRPWRMDPDVEEALATVVQVLCDISSVPPEAADAEAIRLLGPEGTPERIAARGGDPLECAIAAARDTLFAHDLEPSTFEAEARYRWIRSVTARVVRRQRQYVKTRSDRVDQVVTHRIIGPILFVLLMAIIFEAIFAWANVPVAWIEAGVGIIGEVVGSFLPPGPFRSLLVDGVIAGVGSVLVFLPQILFLFFFISLLEDTGYMARVALMMDKLMRRVGLHGKAFIPLLSSFACAVPGIMATRTIENRKDRFVTILIAPLMACSARLPIYTLLIAAFVPGGPITKGMTLLGLYLLGIVSAVTMALVFKRTLLKSATAPLVLELPSYKWPSWKSVVLHMWDRSRIFVRRAGTVILSATILLWFLASYPEPPRDALAGIESQRATLQAQGVDGEALASLDAQEASLRLRSSFAGRFGRLYEPVIEPLGFDWKIGIGILASFAAREVFVGAMSTIYSVGDASDDTAELERRLADAKWDPGSKRAGEPIFTLPTALALLVFYVFALQCMSTIAIIRRETNSWRWPLFAWAYLGVLAYAAAWITYRVANWVV